MELEQRGAKIHSLLNSQDHIKKFEQIMTERFFKYSKKVLAIHQNYTDWLIDYLRRQNQTEESLVTRYFSSFSLNLNHIQKKKNFLDFYNLLLLAALKQLLQKFFANNPIVLLNLKQPILWILFK